MATAIERIVVQATTKDKKAIAAKAKRLEIPISELMRRGAFAYQSSETDLEMAALADAAKGAADRAGKAIDDALDFIEASNKRIGGRRDQTEGGLMGVTDKIWAALTSMIKLEDKVNRQAEAMKAQQMRIEDLTGRVIRLEAQLEIITGAALVRKLKGD